MGALGGRDASSDISTQRCRNGVVRWDANRLTGRGYKNCADAIPLPWITAVADVGKYNKNTILMLRIFSHSISRMGDTV